MYFAICHLSSTTSLISRQGCILEFNSVCITSQSQFSEIAATQPLIFAFPQLFDRLKANNHLNSFYFNQEIRIYLQSCGTVCKVCILSPPSFPASLKPILEQKYQITFINSGTPTFDYLSPLQRYIKQKPRVQKFLNQFPGFTWMPSFVANNQHSEPHGFEPGSDFSPHSNQPNNNQHSDVFGDLSPHNSHQTLGFELGGFFAFDAANHTLRLAKYMNMSTIAFMARNCGPVIDMARQMNADNLKVIYTGTVRALAGRMTTDFSNTENLSRNDFKNGLLMLGESLENQTEKVGRQIVAQNPGKLAQIQKAMRENVSHFFDHLPRNALIVDVVGQAFFIQGFMEQYLERNLSYFYQLSPNEDMLQHQRARPYNRYRFDVNAPLEKRCTMKMSKNGSLVAFHQMVEVLMHSGEAQVVSINQDGSPIFQLNPTKAERVQMEISKLICEGESQFFAQFSKFIEEFPWISVDFYANIAWIQAAAE